MVTLVGLVVLAGLVVPASAEPTPPASAAQSRGQALRALWAEATRLLVQASEARRPALVPPVPVSVRWSARRISSLLLDAPLLALASADLDGDRRDELIALTTAEVVVIGQNGRTLATTSRTRLVAEPAAVRPRDPVGTVAVLDTDADGHAEVAVRSSELAWGVVLAQQGKALVERGRIDGFPLCAGATARLAPGRNYFDGLISEPSQPSQPAQPNTQHGPPVPERFLSAHCRSGLVDGAGHRMDVAGAVAVDHTLVIAAQVACAPRAAGCSAQWAARHPQAGTAFAIADLDRDGRPEIAISQAAAPGDPDRVVVLSWTGERLVPMFERQFHGGVVGLAAGDIDGDGATELVGAVRLLGSNRVDLWAFNE